MLKKSFFFLSGRNTNKKDFFLRLPLLDRQKLKISSENTWDQIIINPQIPRIPQIPQIPRIPQLKPLPYQIFMIRIVRFLKNPQIPQIPQLKTLPSQIFMIRIVRFL